MPGLFYTCWVQSEIALHQVQGGRTTLSSRKETRSAGDRVPGGKITAHNARPILQSHWVSKVLGVILIAMAFLWLGWLLLYHFGVRVSGLSFQPLPSVNATGLPTAQTSPLPAGISLGHPTQTPALTEQGATFIASQLEPDAATKAKKTSSQYVLLSYAGTNTSTSHPDFHNVPAWMILYQQIPLAPADPSVDATPFPQTHHDLYVFLDANTGKELLALWV